MTRLLPVFLAFVAFEAFAQAATALDWQKVIAAAKKEGPVMLYTLQSAGSVDRVISGFRKAYPDIALQYLRSSTVRLSSRLDRERTANTGDGADVWINVEPAWLAARSKDGHLLKLTGPAAAAWPAQFMSANSDFATGGLELQAIAYDKRLSERPPKAFSELLKPEYRDMIGTSEPASGVIAAWYMWLEKSEGAEYLTRLRAQNPKLYNNPGALMEALVSGEVALAAFSTPTLAKQAAAQGATVEFVVPQPTAAVPLYVAAMGWSKKQNAALLLADFFLSKEGQAAWHGLGESASPLSSAGAELLDASAFERNSLFAFRERWNKVFR